MATLYTGNSAAVQAPSPAPGVGVDPIISLPADTDGWTVANFFQALKVVADFISFLRKIVGGVLSAKSMLFDGTGGQAAAPPDGTCQVATNISGTVQPTAAPVRGALYRDLIPLAWGHVNVNGGTGAVTSFRGANISQIFRNAAGDFLITMSQAAPNTDYAVIATPIVRGADYTATGLPITNSQFAIDVFLAGAPQDAGFMFVVFSV